MARRGAVLGEWEEQTYTGGENVGGKFYTREVRGFEDLWIEPLGDGRWMVTGARTDEHTFATRNEAEAFAFSDSIAYVEELRNDCERTIAALKAALNARKETT
jgi:hypothetical protein